MPSLTSLTGTAGGTMLILGAVLAAAAIPAIWIAGRRAARRMTSGDPAPERGIPAQAIVLQLRQTGRMVNNQPQLALGLEVRPPSGEPYLAQFTTVIPVMAAPQVELGAILPVTIHPGDPRRIDLDLVTS